jgi:hypothetical protein
MFPPNSLRDPVTVVSGVEGAGQFRGMASKRKCPVRPPDSRPSDRAWHLARIPRHSLRPTVPSPIAHTPMIQNVLNQKLRPLIEAERTLRRRKVVATILLAGALAASGLLALAVYAGWWSWPAILATFGLTSLAAMIGVWWADSRTVDVKTLAERIEAAHPDLHAALLTAVEQRPDEHGQLGYLQERVVFEAVDHAIRHNWVRRVSNARMAGAGWAQFFAAIAFGVALWFLVGEAGPGIDRMAEKAATKPETAEAPVDYEIAVLPGDTEVERGARLIVEAKFGKRLPPDAVVVIRDPGAEGAERGRVAMKPGLDETVFSGIIAKVDADAVYRVEFDGEESDEFSIATYVHPALERADAEITPPAYANQETKKLENVQKVSLLEGSNLAWTMKVNKPVAAAELFGEDESVIPLTPSPEDPTVLVAAHEPKETRKYRLHLVDEKERSNQRPPWFTVTVMKNLPPKLDFVFPKRDVDVSALQELPVEAKLWDDIGILKAGATLTLGDQTRDIVLAEAALPGGTNHEVRTQFSMEELGAAPRDLVAYHLWAEDTGPDGKPRRTQSDLFFAEVRHFEDIFREQENMGGPPGGQQPGGGQAEKLLKLQKDVMNAGWKLIRQTDMGKTFEDIGNDIGVVRESQQIAITQTEAAAGEVEDAELKAHFAAAAQHMGQAVETLGKSVDFKDTKQLRPAHDASRKAYESLIRARSREHNVTRAQDQQSAGGQGQQKEQQLMQLEMKQKDLRYQEERKAQDPQQTAEQQENLEVLNRLKELARRQEAIAKKIQELENALQEAKTEEEKQELERQLKRLQEEQEQLLRDLDDVSEKMNSEENRANMAEERQELEKTREDVREAADKLEEGNLADAANAATRAERQLDEVKEDFRKKTSRKFEDEMRNIRDQARQLAENQEAIGQKLEEKPREESPLANAGLAREIQAQKEALAELLEQMREVSEQAEESEPILSSAMYEAVREATMGGLEESLTEAGDLTRYNRRELAQESERAAARGIEELKADVEKAAEKVLGSEADALRMARSELEDLIEQSRAEAERLGGGKKPEGTELAMNETGKPGADPKGREPGDPTEQGRVGDQTGSDRKPGDQSGQESEKPGEEGGAGAKPGEGEGKEGEKEPSAENAKGQGGEPGEGQEPGKGGAQGKEPGEGEGKGDQGQQMAEAGKGQGKGKGEGQEPGEQPGEGEGRGKGQQPGQTASADGQPGAGQQPGAGEGQQPGQGQQPGEGQGPGQGQRQGGEPPRGYRGGFAGQDQPGGQPQAAGGANDPFGGSFGGPNFGGGEDQSNRGLPTGIAQGAEQAPLFFQGEGESDPEGPITGRDYEEWADRLRNVENMVEADDLRNELARVLDDARAMRIDFRKNNLPPQAATINQRITTPLVEIRDRLAEELAKLDKNNPLAPIDRDPVPREYRELVRRYYEELGSGR